MLKLRQVILELDPNYPIAQTLNRTEHAAQSAPYLLKRHDVAETQSRDLGK